MSNDKIQPTDSQFILYQDSEEATHKFFLLVRNEGNISLWN
jgi:hypothetical protein